jgi:hypothetical protein
MTDSFFKTVFSLGSPCNGHYGHLVFKPHGKIFGYSQPNERSWSLEGDELCFHAEDGRVSSRLRHVGEGIWSGHMTDRKWPLYLMPLLSLQSRGGKDVERPPVIVNSIPKAGTYFLEAALADVGFVPSRLQLGGRTVVHDYRDVPEVEIHRMPRLVELQCPLAHVAAALEGGDVAVGHVEFEDILTDIRQQGVLVLSVVRDLRSVIQSLFRFKLTKVAPVDAADVHWRTLEGDAQLAGFLKYYHGGDLDFIRRIGRMMAKIPGAAFLRYETLSEGRLDPACLALLEDKSPELARKLSDSLAKTKGTKTPTWSGGHSSWQDMWTYDLEVYFRQSGMQAVNELLGYY